MDKDSKYNNNERNSEPFKSNKADNDWEQLSHKLGDDTSDLDDESFFDEINKSLASQISMEMEGKATNTKVKPVVKKKKYKGLRIFAIIFSIIMLFSALLLFTSGGRKILLNIAGKYIYDKLEYDDTNKEEQVIQKEEKKEEDKHVVNILLIGVEEIEGASNTDLMIIASMNTKEKTLKLTSLMRDLYVEIPGYNNNRLNSVYAKDGIGLLYKTIKNNFGISMDGYALVNFKMFEQIVDIIGGVEVTLTSKEANYLNTTNYISERENRNVVAGTQIMNGNQALGYCRVRKVSTGTESNDFGRTQRQRAVLNAIFEKIKSKNIIQLGLLMNEILNDVKITTDITQSEFNTYLEEAVSLNVSKLQQLRIPSDGNYENVEVKMGSYYQEVLQPKDWAATREEIRKFIYGNEISKDNLAEE